jgi:hypothetical protein
MFLRRRLAERNSLRLPPPPVTLSQAGLVLALEALEFDAPTQFIVRCE